VNKTKAILDKAQQALALKAEIVLLEDYHTRYKHPDVFMESVKTFDDCRFWRDMGFDSMAAYGHARMPQTRRSEWKGWVTLAKINPPEDIVKLVRLRKLHLEVVAELEHTLTRYNYRTWLFLAMYLGVIDLRLAVREWRKMARTGYQGEAVFVPLWIPEPEYKEVFSGSDYKERPWDVIKRGLLAKRDQ